MNKNALRAILCILLVLIAATPVCAIEFQPIGFEPMSMGGAGVASARGSFATYYNPALLAVQKHVTQIDFSAGSGIREINVAQHIDDLADIGIDKTFEDIKNLNPLDPNIPQAISDAVSGIKGALRSMSTKNGIQLMPTVSLGFQIKRLGLGVYGLSEATAYAIIDPQRTDFIVDIGGSYYEYDEINSRLDPNVDVNDYNERSVEYALDPNHQTTYLKLTGLAYAEIYLAYAHTFQILAGDFSVGSAVKIMPGYTFDEAINIDTESGDIDNELRDREKRDTTWGIDVGFLYTPQKFERLTMGLVLKNLNTPEFKTIAGNTLEVEPQARAGLEYELWKNRFTLAFDADLTNNKTFVPGYESQFIGGGFNFHPWSWLCLRGGAMHNIKDNAEGTVLTTGLGFGLKWLQVDAALQMSTKTTEFDREKIPSHARVQLSLVSKWF